MSTLTFPTVAALVRDEGPFYAAYPAVRPAHAVGNECDVIWLAAPVLLDASLRWADDTEVRSAHVTLDAPTLAALIFCSALNTGGDPGEYELLDAIDSTLAAYRCHVERCVNRHDAEVGDYPEDTARRWTWCVVRAARLLGIAP